MNEDEEFYNEAAAHNRIMDEGDKFFKRICHLVIFFTVMVIITIAYFTVRLIVRLIWIG
jgi:hypothetical protein